MPKFIATVPVAVNADERLHVAAVAASPNVTFENVDVAAPVELKVRVEVVALNIIVPDLPVKPPVFVQFPPTLSVFAPV